MRVDPRDFHWLEKPDAAALEAATEELNLLGALDNQQNLTPLGHLIGDLQIDPGIAHMIYYACFKGLGNITMYLNLIPSSFCINCLSVHGYLQVKRLPFWPDCFP